MPRQTYILPGRKIYIAPMMTIMNDNINPRPSNNGVKQLDHRKKALKRGQWIRGWGGGLENY